MSRRRYALFAIRAWWELARYDLIGAIAGFRRIHRQLARRKVASKSFPPEAESFICDAVRLASCFYFKPVLCLQRSVAAAHLLRKAGINGSLVIGYRPAPFFSHAWVEVDGRVVNDSPAYKERLQVLYRG